ncbi:MAG: hypothetical protein JKX81_19190, partial [Arenicella sp.]|nr:hypothetical protein [Arenicella sp.]
MSERPSVKLNKDSSKEDSFRVYFEESGGGWGNPLSGLVFDSDVDLPEGELQTFRNLFERFRLNEETTELQQGTHVCAPTKLQKRRGPPGPSDSKSFRINAEIGAKKIVVE